MKYSRLLLIGILLCLVLIGTVNAFSYTSQYPPAQSGTYVKATTMYGGAYPYYTTDPAKSLTGTWTGVCWVSTVGNNADQRFHIDLGSAKPISRIYYENGHLSGAYTENGAKNFTFWGSNVSGSFANLTYGADTGWTQLTASQTLFDEHVELDQADPKYITVTNTNAYRYYAFKFSDVYGPGVAAIMVIRRIELQMLNPDPVASFNLVLTDTSTGIPTSWQWNATNLLGNNTPVTISTDQNPILTLSQGNWLIDLIATNAEGSDTCNSTIGINLTSPQVYFWSRTS